MIKKYILSFLLIFIVFQLYLYSEQKNIHQTVDKLVNLIIDTDATEFRTHREVYILGDITYVFFFTESEGGGNNHYTYLSVFENYIGRNNISKYLLLGYATVGGKGIRHISPDSIKINKNKIILNIVEYAADDPQCCPSLKGKVTYLVSEGKLTEIKK